MQDRRAFLAVIAASAAVGWCSRPTAWGSGPGAGDEPPYPAPDPAAVARFRKWQADNAMPAAYLVPTGPAPAMAGGTRIGGPAWLGPGESWPRDGKGRPMSFLGQVDFAALPQLPDYPAAGVLQFFIGRDLYYGADPNHPDRGQFRLAWRPDFAGGGRLQHGPQPGGDRFDMNSPLEAATVAHGVALAARSGTSRPTINSWQFARDLPDLASAGGRGTVNAMVQARLVEQSEVHHVGGHPQFTQDDWRGFGPWKDYDRVLLNLWSDKHIMWGDMGQGQFMIRRADLLQRDFSRVCYSWDCS